MMFIKWLKRQILPAIIGFGVLWVIWRTGDQTGGVVGGPGHYQDGWLFTAALIVGFMLTLFGSFTRRKDGSLISGLGLLLMVGAVLWVWKV